MSKDAMRLKIAGLITMFGGLGVLIWAIVCAVQAPDLTDALQGVAGVGGAFMGAQGARTANVPSSAENIVKPAFIAFFVGAALFTVGYIAVNPPSITQLWSICGITFLVLLVGIFAKMIVEALKRK